MELNMNCLKGHILEDDDNFSNISRISCGLHNSINSACNSDSECSGPISVRNMIQHYNNQCKNRESNPINHKNTYKINATKKHHHPSQHLLPATRSSYCGLNNYGSYTSCKQFADQIENADYSSTANTCCKSCIACGYCQNGSLRKSADTTKMLSSTPNENNTKPKNTFSAHSLRSGSCLKISGSNCNKINAKDTRMPVVENCSNTSHDVVANINNDTTTATSTIIQPTVLNDFCTELNKDSRNNLLKMHNSQVAVEEKKNHLLSTDSVGEANVCQQPPLETSYQSKTTIAKTSSGVRIIIDIFFDQERNAATANDTSILASRVETDLPQSRILAEFQQQTMAAGADDVSSSCQGV